MSEEHVAELLNQLFKPQLEALVGMLAGFQGAFMAIIGKLAQRQILTLEDLRVAIAGALALLNEANATSPQGTVLRQIPFQALTRCKEKRRDGIDRNRRYHIGQFPPTTIGPLRANVPVITRNPLSCVQGDDLPPVGSRQPVSAPGTTAASGVLWIRLSRPRSRFPEC
jgi:hypothetical protein